MAHSHTIKIEIIFNEHDNEQVFIRKLFHYLHRLKHDMDSLQSNGDTHEDIYYNVIFEDIMKNYMTEQQQRTYLTRYYDFPNWGNYRGYSGQH